eukprot:TRINITY_DN3663_c0_g1_i1.p1 TRINITY_DN3663_c0_g1~~TRINITY_DN3663_c0_g1_i1.p1  ORF type:complete len:194 (-),score=61.44 TRINITY_DN3663_c0_g1_i1:44-625(-)
MNRTIKASVRTSISLLPKLRVAPLSTHKQFPQDGDDLPSYGKDRSAEFVKAGSQESQGVEKAKKASTSSTKATDHKEGDCRFETEREAVNSLVSRGFTEKFGLKDGMLVIDRLNAKLNIDKAKLVEIHRFEGDSNPDDMTAVFAIEAQDEKGTKHKGVFTSAYGPAAPGQVAKFIQKVSQQRENVKGDPSEEH